MKCSVDGCRTQSKFPLNKSLFRFPKESALKMKWLEAIRRQDFTPNTKSGICEDHFKKCDIVVLGKSKRLKSQAMPTVIDMSLPQERVTNNFVSKPDTTTSKDIQFVKVQTLSEFELIPMPIKDGEIKEEPDPLLVPEVNKQIPTISLIESDSEDVVEIKSNQPLIITLDSDSEDDANTNDSEINSNTLPETSLLNEPCNFPQSSVSNIQYVLPGRNVSIMKVPTIFQVPPQFCTANNPPQFFIVNNPPQVFTENNPPQVFTENNPPQVFTENNPPQFFTENNPPVFTENNPSLNQTANTETYTPITKRIRTIKQVLDDNEPDKNEAEVLAKIRIVLKYNTKWDKIIQSLEQKALRNKEKIDRLKQILNNFKDRIDLPEVHARLTPENISELTFLRQCHLVQNKPRKQLGRKGKSEPVVSDNFDKSTESSNSAIAADASQATTTIPDINNVGTDLYEEELFNEIIEVCSPAEEMEHNSCG